MVMYKTITDAINDGFVVFPSGLNHYDIVGYQGKETEDVVFPSIIEGKKVNVSNSSTGSYKNLKSIKLGYKYADEDNNVIIYKNAFRGCKNLIKVDFGPAIANIGDGAFKDCANLKTVLWGENTYSIGERAFENTAIEAITAGNTIMHIKEYAFTKCDSLKTVILPEINTIGNGAFYGCQNLKTISFPEKNLKRIGIFALAGTAISDIYIPRTAQIEALALSENPKLNEVWLYEGMENIPNNLTIKSPNANIYFYA